MGEPNRKDLGCAVLLVFLVFIALYFIVQPSVRHDNKCMAQGGTPIRGVCVDTSAIIKVTP